MALNLEECVAITQNFVSKANLRKVIAFLDTKCEALLSGLDKSRRGSLGELFNEALKSSPDDEVQSILCEVHVCEVRCQMGCERSQLLELQTLYAPAVPAHSKPRRQ